MKIPLPITTFQAGFYVSLCLFSALNAISYRTNYTRQLFHEFGPFSIYEGEAYGFPFSYYITWPPPDASQFFASELAANVVLAFVVSVLIGFVLSLIWPKIKAPQD
jgi:hypothetical protein